MKKPISIDDAFDDSVVFITGGTGFLGKLLLEKLLRSCPRIKKIYIIVREKKGKDSDTRLQELLNSEVFEPLKVNLVNPEKKIEIIRGDLTQSNLGISEEDWKKLTQEVNFVFHVAATTRFDENIRTAVNTNVKATKYLLKLANEMASLKAFVYTSTAYSFSPYEKIKEKFYAPPINPEELIRIAETFDNSVLESVTPKLLGQWPNTYVFTKAVAEDIVRRECQNLPLVVVRPSIVTGTYYEPLSGWIDNIFGMMGVCAGIAAGLIRTMQMDLTTVVDLVPGDYTVNCIIATAWDVSCNRFTAANRKGYGSSELYRRTGRDDPIYNYVSGPENPLLLGTLINDGILYYRQMPSSKTIWYICFVSSPSLAKFKLLNLLLHVVPAYLADRIAVCLGRKPRLMDVCKKMDKQLTALSHFACRQWQFENENTRQLWNKLMDKDRETFKFNTKSIDWNQYLFTAARGVREYLLKDTMETLPQGKVRFRNFKMAHYATTAALILLFVYLIFFITKYFITQSKYIINL